MTAEISAVAMSGSFAVRRRARFFISVFHFRCALPPRIGRVRVGVKHIYRAGNLELAFRAFGGFGTIRGSGGEVVNL